MQHVIKEYVKESDIVLNVGCGNSYVLQYIRTQAHALQRI